MSGGKLYLKVKEYNGYDDYYLRLDQKDPTFSNILSNLEMVLDRKYLNNEDKLEGIKVDFEIVSLTEEQYNNIEWDDE